ncbi:conjugal transfer protein TraH [Enterobacter asburiae]|uniref:conjugal transfer protein TraH n=1 Tax=Enterobacter asburiae TaxID=61645 RepID=UPI001BDED8E1|nr:conjugal transfer protein TraH [Enterobacter asburiae]MBT1734900.1 conjugal transfer protein TraH [Enterobacter asburiae]
MVATNTTAKKPAKTTRQTKSAEKIAQSTEQKLVQLLADTPVQIFPYSRLSHTGLNTRIIPHTDQEVEEMADSIQAMGILQNLIGAELPDGTIGIVGGEGRRRGTGILVMRGVLDADTPFVPVPELKQAKDFLQKLASDVNSMNMSSCQAAQGIIGGLWPVTQVSQQKICQDIAGETNMFSDWAASRQGCTVGGQGDKVTAKAGDAEKDQVLKNKNLIWDTLSKNGLLGNDRALKELVMSTVGSIIFNKNGDVTILTPLVDNRDLIKVLMRGGTAKVYGCDESTLCLGPVVTSLTISESNALVTLVKNLMLSMQNKLVDDTALTDQEKGFVNTTSVPVLKYLTNAQSMGMSATYLLQVSDFIAQDLMIQYLQELVKQASLSLAGKNFPEEAAAKLRDNIIHAQGLLADMKLQSAADQNALDGIDRNMQYLQQQVSTIVSGSYQSNYHWGDR